MLCALLALECEVKFTGAGRMSLADLCEEGYPRDVLERVVVHRRPYQASCKCLRRRATDFPVVNVAAAYWGDEWHVAVGARSCRARLLTGSQLGLESKRPSREELARALEAVRTLPGKSVKKRVSAEVWSNSALVRTGGGQARLLYASIIIARAFWLG